MGARPKRMENLRWRAFRPNPAPPNSTSCTIIVVERHLALPLPSQFADGYAREVRAGHLDQPLSSLVMRASRQLEPGDHATPPFAALVYIDCSNYWLRIIDGACISTCPSAIWQTACGVTCLSNLGMIRLAKYLEYLSLNLQLSSPMSASVLPHISLTKGALFIAKILAFGVLYTEKRCPPMSEECWRV